MVSTPITLAEILHGSAYSLDLFTNSSDNAIQRLEERIKVKTNKKGVAEPFVTCIVRDKDKHVGHGIVRKSGSLPFAAEPLSATTKLFSQDAMR